MVLFIVIHAVGNLHVFKGPDDFNGYGYLCDEPTPVGQTQGDEASVHLTTKHKPLFGECGGFGQPIEVTF